MGTGRLTDLSELTITSEFGCKVLSLGDKRAFYRDGYIIIKGAVSKDIIQSAKRRIKAAKKGEDLSEAKELLDLVNASNLTPLLHEAMGYFDPVSFCQVGVIPKSTPNDSYTVLGYPDKDVPYYGASTHLDGICTIFSGTPQDPKAVEGMTPEQKYQVYINSGRDPRKGGRVKLNEGKAPGALPGKPQPGRSCEVVGENSVPLFQDKACTLGLGSFTAFLIIALNDQMRPGCGQTAVLKGSHHAAERFFQMQRATGGIMGIEGAGWDRINPDAPGGFGLNYLPQPIWDEYTDEAKHGPLERTPDGRVWPRPIQMLMEEGDACLTVFHIAHAGTRNVNGTESRKNMIFRIRAKAHNPNVIATGVSDYPDRGHFGAWLDPGAAFHRRLNPVDRARDLAREWFDPFERSKHLLCHPWEVWKGMQEVVSEARAGERPLAAAPRARL